MLKVCSFLPLLLLFALSACKNELKLNAPYKEYPSIYAVLNPAEPEQTIRVNKVFLGEQDANVMAKVADSVNYKPGEITVTLNHNSAEPVVFSEKVIETQPGAFSTTQRVYVSQEPLQTFGVYTLTVKNNKTGNVFTATTVAIPPIKKEEQLQNLFNEPFYPYPPETNPDLYIDYTALEPRFPYQIRFYTNSAELYNLTLRMHFYDSLLSGTKIERYVDYNAGNVEKKGKREVVFAFRGADIFNAAGIGLSRLGLSNSIAGRKMYKMEYIIQTTTQDYIDYLQYSAPSLSINQNKPLYSNFEEAKALGIFTFRTTFSMSKSLANPFINAFSSNPNTCNYNFYTSSLGKTGCR